MFVPGKTKEKQARFAAFVAALVRTVSVHGDVIRAEDLQLTTRAVAATDVTAAVTSNTGAAPLEPADQGSSPQKLGLENYIDGLEREAINKALEESRYNKTAAAKKLGITFRALRYRLKKLGID